MSDFDGAPTGATGPYMTSFEDDDEMFAALDWHVDPTLSDYWDRVTIDQLLNMSDEKFSRTVMEWQRITQASNLDITSIDIDSDCRALLDNSLEFGELTEAPGASASVPLEPSVPVTSAPETTSSKGKKPSAAIKAAAWRRRRKEKDPNFADKGASFTSSLLTPPALHN
ncbi:hypothetical protein L202_03882 [Cryptococcus amylolentus CBS 6039]|uniref:Uncharacterized protein n=1 Tax=Cryptococcus amylolentus CBS 6039 TaxID=1295533 RepID=A0A1E3HWN4_9TREE|nr:hypothetical protein L202_03882 [Cryptococcus amylolentus CBS 6039]ODN80021.1 hypothetical protein L202_03882 [Cryptococcus amylolentus CBS 6039]